MSKGIEIHLCLNRLLLPEDIMEEIKGFVFYDKVTGNTRLRKQAVVHAIDTATHSRKMKEDYHESWAFWTGGEMDPQMQALHCITCGNYQISYVFCEKTRCLCPGQEYHNI